ncbi:RNA-directed DNA polymerase, eukaryota, reverse transcriptase zinc-binding domain protein [Tanacetum coccineum]|uniref:RNA-directed DNA polymerase, eukaryota, reverse transcriptase zinc-binding domain protein n=1 Tax=Tanacetum coccineum TaxID=301880 RepID=A0ABQ5CQ23_9ASTR
MRERAKYGATKKGVQKVKSKISFTTKSDSSMSTRVSSDVNGGSFKEMRDNKIRETLEIKSIWGIDVDYFHGPSAGASSGTLLKEALWYDLLSIMSSRDGIWLLMGDFNVVRSKEERAGSKLMRRKLQVSTTLLQDHNHLLLSVGPSDFGPKSFKFFDTWMGLNDFDSVVTYSWSTESYREVWDVVLKNKIKKLRADIKDWSHKKHVDQSRNKKEICDRIKDWDEKEENGLLTEFDITNRDEDRMELIQIDQMERNMLVQKSRINWAIEGDENSRFFHNYINKNYRRNNIMGLMWNGIWSIDPSIIKQAAFRHFSTRFKEPIPNRVVFSSLLFRQLEFDDVCLLKAEFSLPEVKAAIWNCSRSKAPGPDGLNFNFIKSKLALDQNGVSGFEGVFLRLRSQFLLIVIILESCNKGIFKGLKLKDEETNLSLLQYADDALIFGEWLRRNVKNLISILNSFRDVSGLGVNLSKSSIFGVGVNIEEVKNVASSSNCKFGSLLFIHLGLPVGRDMSKKERWLDAGPILMERFSSLKAPESNKNCSLREKFPRLGARVETTVEMLVEWRVPPSDGWDWLPNSGNAFIVKHLSKMIDDITLGENNLAAGFENSGLSLILDETLFPSVPANGLPPPGGYDFVVRPLLDGERVTFYVVKRPFVDEFLEFLSVSGFEIVVFTAGIEEYASLVLEKLDKKGVISHKLYRDSCKECDGRFVKDLSGLGRDLKKLKKLMDGFFKRCDEFDDLKHAVKSYVAESVKLIDEGALGDSKDSNFQALIEV